LGFVLARNPDTLRGPDVSFVSKDRAGSLANEPQWFEGAPDLAIEILSPSDLPSEIHAKIADYLAAGSRLVWVVDPKERSVRTYRSLLAPRRLSSKETLDAEDVLPGFTIAVAKIFGD
jgi:Uma2 family endonuclease